MRRKNEELERNQLMTSVAVFMESYNQTIPLGFPRVSIKALKEFQVAHPMLFKKSDEWSIERHRKRLMDWLISHRELS